jgi:hypothetical protein
VETASVEPASVETASVEAASAVVPTSLDAAIDAVVDSVVAAVVRSLSPAAPTSAVVEETHVVLHGTLPQENVVAEVVDTAAVNTAATVDTADEETVDEFETVVDAVSEPSEDSFAGSDTSDGFSGENNAMILLKMGLMETNEGNVRIFLSKQNNKEYLTIRETRLPYADVREMIDDFDDSKRRKNVLNNEAYIRKYHVFYARLGLSFIGWALSQYFLYKLANF